MRRQRPEHGATVAAPIEDQQDRLVTSHRLDLGEDRGQGAGQGVIERPVQKEERAPGRVMHVDVGVARLRQAAFRIPPFRDRVLPRVGREVAVDRVRALPDRLELHDGREQRPHHHVGRHALGDRAHLRPQGLHARRRAQSEQPAEVPRIRGLEAFDRPQPQGEPEGHRPDHLRHAQRRPSHPCAHVGQDLPHADLRQGHMEEHRAGIDRGRDARGRRDRRRVGRRGLLVTRERTRGGGGAVARLDAGGRRLRSLGRQRRLRRLRLGQDPPDCLIGDRRRGRQGRDDRPVRPALGAQCLHAGDHAGRHLHRAVGSRPPGRQGARPLRPVAPAQRTHVDRGHAELRRHDQPGHPTRFRQLHHHMATGGDVTDGVLRDGGRAHMHDFVGPDAADCQDRREREASIQGAEGGLRHTLKSTRTPDIIQLNNGSSGVLDLA